MGKRGFTLIELLIVIGVLAILATIVTLVLNPAEILKQTRDAQRISDLRSLRSAIDLYLIRAQPISGPLTLYYPGADTVCETGDSSFPNTLQNPWRASLNALNFRKAPFVNAAAVNSATISSVRSVSGDGWVPVNFTDIIGSSPLPKLPLDPVNSAPTSPTNTMLATPNQYSTQENAYFYAYFCQGLTYEIAANMESQKYSYGGVNDVESRDGGREAKFWNTSLEAPNFCTDPINDTPGEPCYDAAQTSTYIADQIYQIGNAPGLAL